MVSTIASEHSCHRFDSHHFKNYFRGKNIDFAEVNQLRWLEESGQWLENVDQTHLILASGKSVLKKLPMRKKVKKFETLQRIDLFWINLELKISDEAGTA